MIVGDVNGRMRSIPNEHIYQYFLSLIPKGTGFYVFTSISFLILGIVIGRIL